MTITSAVTGFAALFALVGGIVGYQVLLESVQALEASSENTLEVQGQEIKGEFEVIDATTLIVAIVFSYLALAVTIVEIWMDSNSFAPKYLTSTAGAAFLFAGISNIGFAPTYVKYRIKAFGMKAQGQQGLVSAGAFASVVATTLLAALTGMKASTAVQASRRSKAPTGL